ncbi:MAG TPA: hypothetical protein VFZ69_11280 [Longimicrobiales bacterium]
MKRVLFGCGLTLFLALPLAAQQGAPCSYAECALRVRAAGFTRPAAIVRGQNDSVVVSLPGFNARLAEHFPAPDSAYFHALRFDTYNQRAFLLNIAGPLAFVVGSFFTDWGDRPVSSALILGSALGITIYGTQMSNAAADELSRTIWWYNRALVER